MIGIVIADRAELTRDEVLRYSRHLTLPEVGVEGQQRLKAARVLCVGAGGLGSPAALYLAAAGVGTIGLVDVDAVDVSNLQRQIIHGTSDVGRSKLDVGSASGCARSIRTSRIEAHDVTARRRATRSTLVSAYDVIVDGTDNFPTRYLVNDACVLAGARTRTAASRGSKGRRRSSRAATARAIAACIRSRRPPGLIPSCAEGGVLGVLPGIIGTIQATETVKLILGIGEPLVGRFLIYDALRMRFRVHQAARRIRIVRSAAPSDDPRAARVRRRETVARRAATAAGPT